jgi:hypothetical protein
VGRPRQALLNPKFGTLYPEVPANHWLPAWEAAMLRAERLWFKRGPEAMVEARLLPDEHFEFRGGQPRAANWQGGTERLCDHSRHEGVL